MVFSIKLQFKYNLCARQFRKPQVQKLCFIPPKIIFIEIHFGSEQILGLKKIWVCKIFGSEKNFGPKKDMHLKNILGLKKF